MRNLGLDLLRLFAVLLVFGRHLQMPSDAHVFLQLWHAGGWVGVDLFFVLSGFLVSGLLYKEFLRDRSIDVKRFLIRRGFKIYPAFYAMIGFTIALRFMTDRPVPINNLLGELFFFQNYLGGLWNHTWSLAVEEHFYFGIALLCFILLRRSKRAGGLRDPFGSIPGIFVFVSIACLLMRIGNLFLFESFSHRWFLFATHIRIDSLMFGVFLSYHWHFRNLEQRIEGVGTRLLIGLGIALLLPAFFFPPEKFMWTSVFGVVIFYIGAGALVLAMIRFRATSNPMLTSAGALGAASYSIYLWHMPVMSWGWSVTEVVFGLNDFVSYFVFCCVGSLLFGWIMNKVLEWPVLKARDRLFPRTDRQ